jgi:site-specific recombinase XerD
MGGTALNARVLDKSADLLGGSPEASSQKSLDPGTLVNAKATFMMVLAGLNRSPNTLRNYDLTLERWRMSLAERGVTHIRQYTLAQHAVYLNQLASRGLKGTTVDLANALLRGFTKFCFEQGLVDRDPLLGFDRSGSEKPLPKALPWGMVEEHLLKVKSRYMLAAARDRFLIRLMAWTGLRVGEALALKRADVNVELRTIRLVGTKGKEAYQHPFTAKLVPYVEEWVLSSSRQWPTSPWLIPSRTGGRMTTRAIEKAFKRYGIEPPHTYRHTYGTHIMELTNGDLKAAQEMLRHKDIKSTMKYLKLWDVKKRALADLIK